MIRAGRSLAQGLAAARAMFGKSFQPAAALKVTVYFEDGDLAALSHADRGTFDWDGKGRGAAAGCKAAFEKSRDCNRFGPQNQQTLRHKHAHPFPQSAKRF